MTTAIGTGSENSFDPIIPLAFALQGNPGAYILLLGAGISASSGVPASWQVENELILRIAHTQGEEPGDPITWFTEKYGKAPRYDDLLQHLTATQTERQKLLKDFFLPPKNGIDQVAYKPTEAHRAIAKLVSTGRIRIILTTNFDQLMETALRDIGIEPVIVRQESEFHGLAPLHSQECLVVHLHGDYLTPVGLLNTADELSRYPSIVDQLLDQIFQQYGLVIAGWSGRWDVALRTALGRNSNKHYGRYWIDQKELLEEGRDLLALSGSVFIRDLADTVLNRVLDACDSIAQNKPRGPLTVALAVTAAKKALSGQGTAISLHDSMAAEMKNLRSCDVLVNPIYSAANETEEYKRRLEILEVAMAVPLSLIATSVYWGGNQSDSWWFGEVARFATPRPVSGLTSYIELLRIPATAILYASGVAAIASGRYELVRRLLLEPTTSNNNGESVTVAAFLVPSKVLYLRPASEHLYEYLKPIFVEQMGITLESYIESWERFEYLLLAEDVHTQLIAERSLEHLVTNRRKIQLYSEEEYAAEDSAKKAQSISNREVFETERKNLLASHMGKVLWDVPHVRVDGWSRNYQIRIGLDLRREIERDGQSSPSVTAGLCGGNAEAMISTFEIVESALQEMAITASQKNSNAGWAFVKIPFWLDNPGSDKDL